jgi:hypothetical protein
MMLVDLVREFIKNLKKEDNKMKKSNTPIKSKHKINTPIVAKYSRSFSRVQLAKELKDFRDNLRRAGYKTDGQLDEKGKPVKAQKPYRKEAN